MTVKLSRILLGEEPSTQGKKRKNGGRRQGFGGPMEEGGRPSPAPAAGPSQASPSNGKTAPKQEARA